MADFTSILQVQLKDGKWVDAFTFHFPGELPCGFDTDEIPTEGLLAVRMRASVKVEVD